MKNVDTKKLQDLIYSKFSNYQEFIQACSKKGYSPSLSTVKSWFNNNLQGTRSPNVKNLPIIAEILDVSSEELLSFTSMHFKKNNNHINFRYFPDVYASAGLGTSSQSEEIKIISVDESFLKEILDIPIKKTYDIIKINGDSMEPILSNGDFIIVDKSKNSLSAISNADVVIFRKDEDLFCKKIKKEPFADYIFLVSENKKYEDKKVDNIGFEQCEILGAVVSKMTIETFKNFIEVVG